MKIGLAGFGFSFFTGSSFKRVANLIRAASICYWLRSWWKEELLFIFINILTIIITQNLFLLIL